MLFVRPEKDMVKQGYWMGCLFPLLLHANYISPHFSDNAEPYKGVKQTIYQQDTHSRYYKSCSFNCNFSIYV